MRGTDCKLGLAGVRTRTQVARRRSCTGWVDANNHATQSAICSCAGEPQPKASELFLPDLDPLGTAYIMPAELTVVVTHRH